METNHIKEELVHVCRRLYEKGYTQASGGNVSARIPGTDLYAIKRTAVNMGVMTTDDVLIVNAKGEVVEGDGKPSKEINFHLGILAIRPDVNAVVHCHPNYCVAFANNGLELPHTTVTSRKVVGRIPWVGAAPAGSRELAELVCRAFEQEDGIKGILMESHGICAVGPSLSGAYNIADLIENTAKQAYLSWRVQENRQYFERMAMEARG